MDWCLCFMMDRTVAAVEWILVRGLSINVLILILVCPRSEHDQKRIVWENTPYSFIINQMIPAGICSKNPIQVTIMHEWDWVEVWILKGEKLHLKCISTPFFLPSERNLISKIWKLPEKSHPWLCNVLEISLKQHPIKL